MNIKLVKLTAEYKKQLTDMMDEWLAVEKDFSPYAIRKNDYHDFEYYFGKIWRQKKVKSLVLCRTLSIFVWISTAIFLSVL